MNQDASLTADHVHRLQDSRSLTVERLRSLVAVECAGRILISDNPDVSETSKLLSRLRGLPEDCSAVVMADRVVPSDLASGFPAGFGNLVQRLTGQDLIGVATQDLAAAAGTDTIEMLVLRTAAPMDQLDAPGSLQRLPELGPGRPGLTPTFLRQCLKSAIGSRTLDPFHISCLEAGLLLLWNHLDASHRVSQALEGAGSPRTADYWHGLMHRREPDLGNASWWFRTLGGHPAFQSLRTHLSDWMSATGASAEELELLGSRLLRKRQWDPFAMIELCRDGLRDPDTIEARVARRVQYLEFLNLLHFSLTAVS